MACNAHSIARQIQCGAALPVGPEDCREAAAAAARNMGVQLQVLQVDLANGMWVIRNRFQPGAVIAAHRHTGSVLAFTISGSWHYLDINGNVIPGTSWKARNTTGTTSPLTITLKSDTSLALVSNTSSSVLIRAVNSVGNGAAQAIADFGRAQGHAFEVWIEIDVDGHRSGVPPESGTLLAVGEHGIDVACGDGVLRLTELQRQFSFIKEVRGAGLMIGVELAFPCKPVVLDCLEQGMLINCTHDYTLRALPPYIITEQEVDRAITILKRVFRKTKPPKPE